MEIVAAGIDDEQKIIPLIVAFNQSEGIVWKPEPMGAALRHLPAAPDDEALHSG